MEQTGAELRLLFTRPGGEPSGKIALPWPDRIFSIAVDTAPEPGRAVPDVYREWRLRGPARVSGIFEPGGSPQPSAAFILHGRGNACDAAGDFTHWTRDVTGTAAQYRFFGRVRPH